MKKFGKILAMVMVALMMMSTMAFAAELGTPVIEEEIVTITLSGLVVGEEATILVVDEGTELEDITSDNASSTILYIDQLTAVAVEGSTTGAVTFEFDASKAYVVPDNEENAGRKAVDIYCGYTNMGLTDPVKATAELVKGGQVVELIYGDVDGDKLVTTKDALKILLVALGDESKLDYLEVLGDVDDDGSTTTKDALKTLKFALGDSSLTLGPTAK